MCFQNRAKGKNILEVALSLHHPPYTFWPSVFGGEVAVWFMLAAHAGGCSPLCLPAQWDLCNFFCRLAAGTTRFSAGIVSTARHLSVELKMADYSNKLYQQLEQETGVSTGIESANIEWSLGNKIKLLTLKHKCDSTVLRIGGSCSKRVHLDWIRLKGMLLMRSEEWKEGYEVGKPKADCLRTLTVIMLSGTCSNVGEFSQGHKKVYCSDWSKWPIFCTNSLVKIRLTEALKLWQSKVFYSSSTLEIARKHCVEILHLPPKCSDMYLRGRTWSLKVFCWQRLMIFVRLNRG